MPITTMPAPVATPPVEGETAENESEFGVLDQAETTKIRQVVTSVVSFLASKRLLPAMLMRVGPLRVLLPLVWGVHFLRSRRWLAGSSFICMGLLSLVIAINPSGLMESDPADEDSNVLISEDDSQDFDDVSDFGSAEQAEFNILARPNSTSSKPAPAFREPTVHEHSADSQRGPRSAGDQASARQNANGVWLVGTIEDVEDSVTHRSAQGESISRLRQ
ncbi:MAG: hypothetical protein WD648_10635 [Planctomycetaceae bacterium]